MDIRRWNHETHEYDPYTPNPEWVIVLYSDDMERQVNCASCGKDMTYGEGYTSKELHTRIGLGYPVCEACYNKELERFGVM